MFWCTKTQKLKSDGTYDKTGGRAVGSYLWIDNIKVYGETYSAAVIQAIILKATYQSEDKDPTSTRTVNLTVVNKDSESATASKTINITNQFSHAPTLTASAADSVYNKGATGTGILFNGTDANTIESSERFEELQFTVSGLLDGLNEVVTIDGTDVVLSDTNNGVTSANSIGYSVSEVAGTATVTLTHAGLTNTELNTLVDSLAYKNLLAIHTVGNRVATLTYIRDTGAIGGSNDNDENLK